MEKNCATHQNGPFESAFLPKADPQNMIFQETEFGNFESFFTISPTQKGGMSKLSCSRA